MPLPIPRGASTVFIRREAYERAELTRAAIDERLGLTPDEFRVEGDLVVVGPVYDEGALSTLVADLEKLRLEYYDDFFELSGNWPDWLAVFAGGSSTPGRSNPSQPQR